MLGISAIFVCLNYFKFFLIFLLSIRVISKVNGNILMNVLQKKFSLIK